MAEIQLRASIPSFVFDFVVANSHWNETFGIFIELLVALHRGSLFWRASTFFDRTVPQRFRSTHRPYYSDECSDGSNCGCCFLLVSWECYNAMSTARVAKCFDC